MSALEAFHPLVRRWFRERYGEPTDVQARAWPVISAGRHVLAVAPTGSGKTLCAFLWSIDRLASGRWEGGTTRVLYVSPLKALNNDIQRNLLRPLGELRRVFTDHGEPLPELSVLTRSGDTPEHERRRMVRRPPEILITTPESLNLLVSSPRARDTFRGLRTVILDEVHAVASSKRGTHLMTAVERLVPLAGEFQRIALSATVDPPERVGAFVGGFRLERRQGAAYYLARPVELVRSAGEKRLEIQVRFPAAGAPPAAGQGHLAGAPRGWEEPFWDPFIRECLERIRANRSTLIFTNTRRHAEKVARLINELAGEPLAYAHHGSLSREIRSVVERKLKRGELSAIVATSSLELGIDIGELDEVLLLQTPFSVASALQRIGRAGHAVGEVSRGRLYATHGRDLLNAAVMAERVRGRRIEQVRPVEAPLDVLAQVVLSMVGIRPWDIDELYDNLRTSSPYRALPRRQYDLVLDMLAGRYADSRIRELQPRLILDRPQHTVSARGSALPLVYRAGGTIPDRGLYELRLRDAGARIGELDEEFVWERKEGDTFSLGTQSWRITRIDARAVEVVPWTGPVGITPFWRAEKGAREFAFCEAVGSLLEKAERRLQGDESGEGNPGGELAAESGLRRDRSAEEDLARWLEGEIRLGTGSADALAAFLRRQRRATGTSLPHRHHLLIEHVGGPLVQAGLRRTVLHTLWGARVNEPLALVLSAVCLQSHPPGGAPVPEIFADDDCLMIVTPEADAGCPGTPDDAGVLGEHEPRVLLELAVRAVSRVTGGIEELLRLRLEGSGFFGARFRENAGRALLLPRSDFRRRVPLWVTRLRSKRLLDTVRRYTDFPLILETWRSCLREDFDLDTLKQLLGELDRGEIRVSETRTTLPSPFAENITWIQTNQHMYEGDSAGAGEKSRLAGGFLRELVTSPHLRPRIEPGIVRELEEKLQRTARGYSPGDAADLRDWVHERMFVPLDQWNALLEAMRRDHGLEAQELVAALEDRLLLCRLPGAAIWGVCARERLSRLLELSAASGTAPATPEVLTLGASPPAGPMPGGARPPAGSQPGETEPIDGTGGAAAETGRGAAERAGMKQGAADVAGTERWAATVGEWLRYCGPLHTGTLAETLGIPVLRLEGVVESLVEGGVAIYDLLTTDALEPQVCDTENLEALLRLTRRARRPEVRARPIEELPLFLALRQGLRMQPAEADETSGPVQGVAAGETPEATLQAALERLFGYPAAAELWEAEIFPARVSRYAGRGLDGLLRETGLLWFGCGRRRVAFSLEADQELFRTPEGGTAEPAARAGLREARARSFTTWELAEQSGLSSSEATREIWQEVWRGRLTTAGFEALRRGLRSGFRPEAAAGSAGGPTSRRRRGSFDRWRLSRPLEAQWLSLPVPEQRDPMEEEELNRDRVGQLLERYGILFRELLQRELPALRWPQLFRTLRVMELSGEVVSGYFFESIQGLQFLAPDALPFLRRGASRRRVPGGGEPPAEEPLPRGAEDDAVFWMNAADPASPCGLGVPLPGLPSRLPSNHLVYRGSRLVLVSTRGARNLEFRVPPEDPHIPQYLEYLTVRTQREWRPLNLVRVETVNAGPAVDSPYKPALAAAGFVEEYRALVLRARP